MAKIYSKEALEISKKITKKRNNSILIKLFKSFEYC